MSEIKAKITMEWNGRKGVYDEAVREVVYQHKNVVITCAVPDDWALTRVSQFMISLLKAELI